MQASNILVTLQEGSEEARGLVLHPRLPRVALQAWTNVKRSFDEDFGASRLAPMWPMAFSWEERFGEKRFAKRAKAERLRSTPKQRRLHVQSEFPSRAKGGGANRSRCLHGWLSHGACQRLGDKILRLPPLRAPVRPQAQASSQTAGLPVALRFEVPSSDVNVRVPECQQPLRM